MALGDSFTYGALVSESKTYVKTAEDDLRIDFPDKKIEFLNAGVCGWDLLQYEIEMRRRVEQFNPKIITVGILPNDFFTIGDSLSASSTDRNPSTLIKSIIKRSSTLDWFTHLALSSNHVYVNLYTLHENEDSYLKSTFSKSWIDKIDSGCSILSRMKQAADASGIKLVPILIPQRIQALIASNKNDFQDLDSNSLNVYLGHCFDKLNIKDYINILQILSKYPNPISFYFPVDGHLTEEGQEIVGHIISSNLDRIIRKQ